MQQQMYQFLYKVSPHHSSGEPCVEPFLLYGVNSFLFLAEVASQLGYDELDAVTAEDMAMEVK